MPILLNLMLVALNIVMYLGMGQHWYSMAAAGIIIGLTIPMIMDEFKR